MARASYLAVLVAAVLCYAALGAVLRLLPALVDDPILLGLLVGAPALTAVVARPSGGGLADRLSPPPVMFAGAALMGVGVLPALAWSAPGVLLCSRLLVGAGEGVMMSAAVLWLLRLAGPARRGQALGHIGLANYAGLTLGPLLASALGLARGPVFLAAALLPAAGVLVALRAQRPAAQPARSAQRAARAADILVPGAGLMLVNVGYVALLAFGAAAAGSAVLPVFALGVVAVRTFGAAVPDRLGGHRTILVAAPLAVAGLLAIALGGAPAATLAGTVLLAAGQGLFVPALGLLALSRVPPERHGTAAGLFFAFFDAGVGAGGPLVGVVARLTTPAGALVAAAGAVTAAGLISGAPRRPGR
jgi:predicted MFS family arabinose efflux permease